MQSAWVLPEQVCQGRCGTSCAACGVALRCWLHQRRGETGCAHCGQHSRPSAFPRQRCRSRHVSLALAMESCRSNSTPLQPNVRQSRCPRPPICSVLLPTLGKSSLCLSGLESRLPHRCLLLPGALRLHLSKRHVNRQVGPCVTWEILCQHLNASTISGWDTHVHAQERVERHSSPLPPHMRANTRSIGVARFFKTSTARTCGSVAAVELDTPRTQPL